MTRTVLRDVTLATCAGGRGPGVEARTVLDVRTHHAVLVEEGLVAWMGPDELLPATAHGAVELARGGLVTPGLVDPHTHLIFAGHRGAEFDKKMRGVDYRTIAAEGGGIMASVRATRSASDEDLVAKTRARLAMLAAHGATTVEVKSGYGLDAHHEPRLLGLAGRAESVGSPRVVRTFLGAHAVPAELRDDREGYVRSVLEAMLPTIAHHRLAEACDVYLDEGAFTLDESRAILERARALGLHVRAHVGQFAELGGAELVSELGGTSCDHLEVVSDAGLDAMARTGVTAVLLPMAWRTLRQTPPDARRFARHGVAIAIGTDANPGTSTCFDQPLCAALAVRDAGLSSDEALLSMTVHAAHAIGRPELGTLRIGGPADIAVWPLEDPRDLAYVAGGLLPSWVLRAGEIISRSPLSPALG